MKKRVKVKKRAEAKMTEVNLDVVPNVNARCIMGHRWNMTFEQLAEASVSGCAMCPNCGNPATVERVSFKMITPGHAPQSKKGAK